MLLAAGVCSGVVACIAGAADPAHTITGSSIGGVRLGLTASAYVAQIGERPSRTAFPKGISRLVFAKHELHVYLSRHGAGVALYTSSREYRTASGIGPCSRVSALRRAYGRQLIAYRVPGSIRVAAYRLGRLVFSADSIGRVGGVMLTRALNVREVVNLPQCGSGEDEGSGG